MQGAVVVFGLAGESENPLPSNGYELLGVVVLVVLLLVVVVLLVLVVVSRPSQSRGLGY